MNSTSFRSLRPLLLGLSALAFGSLLLTACTTDDKGKGCVGDITVCVTREALRDTGNTLFHEQSCTGCHGNNGQGARGPALANSDWFMSHRDTVIELVLRGNFEDDPFVDSLVVNGRKYRGGGMPPQRENFSDYEIAGILTYLRSVLNDSTVNSATCHPDPEDEANPYICDKTPRTAAAMDVDTVAPWEVAAIRATLPPLPVVTP